MISKNNNIEKTSGPAAKAVLRVVPLIMRTVRAEMRAGPARQSFLLSVPQFRTLNFVDHQPEASLSDVAAHVGVALPSMSRLVDGLVSRNIMMRQGHAGDRRRMTLRLTTSGLTLLKAAHKYTESLISRKLSALDGEELAVVMHAMEILQPLFAVVREMGKKRNP